jgi:hypothetical protein
MPRIKAPSADANPRLDVERWRLRQSGAATPRDLGRELERVKRGAGSAPRLRPVVSGTIGDGSGTFEQSLLDALVRLGHVEARVDAGSPDDDTGDLLWVRRTRSTGEAPTVAAGANLGTTGTVSLVGTDRTGLITFQPGGTGIAAGVLATVTFAEPKPDGQYVVLLSADESDAAVWTWYVGSRSSTAWTLGTTAVLSTAARRLAYQVEEYAVP